ncbi:hypothetical protein NKH77_08860 [Streptomyces sp. M19]
MIKATGPRGEGFEAVTNDAGRLLGHAELEHRRLMVQAHLTRPWTARFLRAAGLDQGMSVLDAGSGLGDVSLVAAEIVGPGGRVVGWSGTGRPWTGPAGAWRRRAARST